MRRCNIPRWQMPLNMSPFEAADMIKSAQPARQKALYQCVELLSSELTQIRPTIGEAMAVLFFTWSYVQNNGCLAPLSMPVKAPRADSNE